MTSLRRKDSPLYHQPPRKKIKENDPSDGEFQVVKASLVLSVPPIFAANPRAGVEELLDSMIMR
jgi:DNA-directed RNA polymerase I subunit RPA43